MPRREGRLLYCMHSEDNLKEDRVNVDDRGACPQYLRRNQPSLVIAL
jgi:hypothetical protein